jgi:transposase InsO family protein
VYLFINKSGPTLLRELKRFVSIISRQYQKNVKIFHSDQDTGLETDHDKWTKDEGFQIEWSAIYTPAQNGSAERSGGVIETKIRYICL